MPNTSQKSWYDNPNAPNIPSQIYFDEKANFAGMLTCAVSYGAKTRFVVILFFRCMSALLNPVNPTREGIKWLLVVHTVAISLFVTVFTAINLDILSGSYIDNRDVRGYVDTPGPLGYQAFTFSTPIGIVSTVTFLLNNLLVDGLLLYRCYIMFSMNPRVIAFPCILYLATIATGVMLVYYQISQPGCTVWHSTTINVGVPYSISVSLDVLLTFMIIARLVLLSREIRNVMNAPFRISGLYKAVITVLGESSALYAVTFLVWIGTWATNSSAQYFFFPILAQAQVIAPLLITVQVANRRAYMSDVVSGDVPSIPSSRGQSTTVGGALSGRRSASLTGTGGKPPSELGVTVVTTVDLHHDKI